MAGAARQTGADPALIPRYAAARRKPWGMQRPAKLADRLDYWTAIAARPRHAVRAKFRNLPDAPLSLFQVDCLHETGHLLKAQRQVDGKSIVVAKWSVQHHKLASQSAQAAREAWWRGLRTRAITEDQPDEPARTPRP